MKIDTSQKDVEIIGDIKEFKPGYPVCSGPNGTVSIMTEEEEEKYPSRIIGTVSEIPTYEEVEKWVVENNLNNQDKPKEKLNLRNIWINGEALVMAVINGKMEVWIR